MRIFVLVAALAAVASPALAGAPYTPPAVTPAETLAPPADLRAEAIKLLKAVRAENLDAVGRFIAPTVTVVSGSIDMTYPRTVDSLGDWKNSAAAVVALGNKTGGDWDLPPGADIGKFLGDMELDFIEGALTDGQPWGTDPLLPGTVCTYGYHDFSAAEVKRVSGKLKVDGGGFVMVPDGTVVRDRPGGRQVATLAAGALYAIDYDSDAPTDWVALHLPEGGVGFAEVGDEGLQKPYAAGLCFSKIGGSWKVVAQASTGL